jgi:hypothetical protein
MSETELFDEASRLIATNEGERAAPLLWRLHQSANDVTKLNAILALLVVLDPIINGDTLFEIADEGLIIAAKLGSNEVRVYLLGKKSVQLANQLGLLIYRQKNLKLSANIFEWIDFSLERDRREYETIAQRRSEIERELEKSEDTILKVAESSTSHEARGNIYSTLGDLHSMNYFNRKLDLMRMGRTRSRMANLHFVRRWNLDRFLYDRQSRKKIDSSRDSCIQYCKKAIEEFELGNLIVETTYATYNLAAKLQAMNYFVRAKKVLAKAKQLAETSSDKRLLNQIAAVEERIAGRNQNIKNYVEELGLDLP